jgi:hypothetical protein
MSQIDPLKKHRHTQETAKRTQSPEAQREREMGLLLMFIMLSYRGKGGFGLVWFMLWYNE